MNICFVCMIKTDRIASQIRLYNIPVHLFIYGLNLNQYVLINFHIIYISAKPLQM